jgi:hypothetical protein
MRPSANPITSKDLPSGEGNLRFLSTLFAQPGFEVQQKTKDTSGSTSTGASFLLW